MTAICRRRAVNIGSYDLEAVIAEHPAVAECAAVAVPTEFAGGEDEVKMCLVLREGLGLEPKEFLAWCEERLPSFAVPRYLEVVGALPKTPNGKVQKHRLREAGVTPATWDRVAAGCQLRDELRRAAARRTVKG